mgnify:CR=1 FL=1
MMPLDELKNCLRYEPDTGRFIWASAITKSVKKCLIGQEAGVLHHSGYVYINIMGKKYAAHRLAWFFVHGEFPQGFLDHINRNKSDNRISNLRKATRSQNSANMRGRSNTGFKGVQKTQGKYTARIRYNYKLRHIGVYATAEEASEAYQKEAKKLFGDFAGAFSH